MLTKRTIHMPTLEEDAAINLGITLDPDTMEVSSADFLNLKPFYPTHSSGRWVVTDEEVQAETINARAIAETMGT